MSDNKGHILIHRKILDHWICNKRHSYSQFEAWVDMLLNVNSNPKEVMIDGKKLIAQRGQSLFSLETWAKRWIWDKSKVRRFLSKLESDKMIVIENEKKTTRITICNYDTYQCKQHKSDTGSTPNNNILPNGSNIYIRKEAFKNELKEYLPLYGRDMLNEFFLYWTEANKTKTKMRFEGQKTWELNLRLNNWNKNSIAKNRKSPSDTDTLLSEN